MTRYHVYGVGNALVDLEFEVPDALLGSLGVDKSLMTLIDEPRHHALLAGLDGIDARPCGGGSAGNTMTAVAQLGGSAFYSCKVADDEEGRFYIADMADNGVDSNLSGAALDDGVTGKCIVMITPDGERSMSTHLGITSKLSVAELDERAIAASDHVYIEGYLVPEPNARAAAIRTREVAVAAGVPVALTLSDVNMVNFFGDGLREIVGDGIDLLFANEDEALAMSGSTEIADAVTHLKTLSKRFAITRGEHGSLLFDGERLLKVSVDAVTPVDSNGAGDVYAGAFLYGVTQGMPFERCGELANTAARTLIQRFGARLDRDTLRAIGERFPA